MSADPLPPAGIVVSLMPTATTVWRTVADMARLAEAAELGGAVAVKVDGPAAVRAVRQATALPVIAVHIAEHWGGRLVITPSIAHAHGLLDAGATIVEMEADAVARAALGQDAGMLLREVTELGAPVKAGVRTVEDGLTAQQAGAAVVGSSIMGYGGAGLKSTEPMPDLPLVERLAAALRIPVSAERGFGTPALARRARILGARYVVVGSAITDPVVLTKRFSAASASPGPRRSRPHSVDGGP